ncbi:selenide, water dikinase [Sulfolobus sp. E5-1-F]|uniref:SelD-related putative sulfur metabolism protein n=1 Tax=Sulfolobaceae TaxID=118883 RepID=UPI001297C4F1|nr:MULTISPECIES: SelD-related putative sulfur metabolism protein [unclassified Sulfolobus]QGA53252.1 selenide, water dikinase [Sulfolobus sp. E5-1-F]QGA68372.1 selenide, water dikinase [Sulfolobus sp. E11-6]
MAIDKLIDKFRVNLDKYKKMGLNPLSLATGCAVKVDLIDTVYPAIHKIRDELMRRNIEILPREDADIFISREKIYIKRIINGGEFDADRAISLIQVNQETAGSPDKFAEFLLNVYTSIKTNRKLTIGKGHSIVTSNPKGEVAVLDLFRLDGEKEKSYTVANNDTIQIVDPLDDPGSQMQVDVAISNSLNDLFTKGVFQDLRMIPVVDAPTEDLKEQLLRNAENYSRQYSIELLSDIQPNSKTLMIGATVIGKSDHELPTYYNRVNENMEILVTRPVGELTPINVFMWMLTVPELIEDMEARGITIQRVEEAKRKALTYMRKPNTDVAKIIYDHLPPFGGSFDENSHIAMTTDVTGPGLFVIKEFAEKAQVDVELFDIPVIDPDIHEFATENFIIPNSTAGTNGAIVIFAHKKVIDEIFDELKRKSQEPHIIGKVIGKGNGSVIVPPTITKYIHRNNVLKQFKIK